MELIDSKQKVYTERHWGKADREEHSRIHLLEHHLADVAACFEALLSVPMIKARLAKAGKLKAIDDVTKARLSVFAALHDVGKANVGFQTQIWKPEDFPDKKPLQRYAGHIQELGPVLCGRDEFTDWFLDELGWDEICRWDQDGGETVSNFLIASLSHHGSPLNLAIATQNPGIWKPLGQLDPRKCVRRIGQLIRSWFPQAFSCEEVYPMPSQPSFQHMFLGLCNLADWVGSDERFFDYCDQPKSDYLECARRRAKRAIVEIGLDIEHQRKAFRGVLSFGELFGIEGSPPPNPMQKSVWAASVDDQLTIIESETGSGKTEAALLRFSKLYEKGLVDGIYFALPTRAAASQLFNRVRTFAECLFPEGYIPEPVLAVPGYLQVGDAKGTFLPGFEVIWDDKPDAEFQRRRWSAESTKRCLAAQIAVGTVDQAMMAALKVKHAHLRSVCLSRSLLVIDEVHASDPYMGVILEALLHNHLETGGYALLMSATLGSVARQRWLCSRRFVSGEEMQLDEAINAPYPAISTPSANGESIVGTGATDKKKSVQIQAIAAMEDFQRVAEYAVKAASKGAKVLIIRNTVGHAVRTQKCIESRLEGSVNAATPKNLLFVCNGVHALHHGRYAGSDRQLLDKAVEDQFGKNQAQGGRIIVGTQTLEQSLDIDADFMITDLCPVDVLLQRTGRLHRHERYRPREFSSPVCMVLLPPLDTLTPLLTESLNGLGPHGYVYEDLRVLEATRRLVAGKKGEQVHWRIPDMNRELVEGATHPAVLRSVAQKMGEEWCEHSNEIEGEKAGAIQSAKEWIIDREMSFCTDNHDIAFDGLEASIRTRLGDEGIEVMFEQPTPSPFGGYKDIACVSIPGHMSKGLVYEEPVKASRISDGFEFRIQESQFKYDRWGLHRMQSG